MAEAGYQVLRFTNADVIRLNNLFRGQDAAKDGEIVVED